MRRICLCTFLALLTVSNLIAEAGEPAPQAVVELAHAKLARLGRDPVIVDAVNKSNLRGTTLAAIAAIDAEWRNTFGLTPLMKSLLTSDCAQRLCQIRDSDPIYAEIFVMDHLGAIVAMTDRTSDYWQGDEAKFKRSFNSGAGAVFIDDVEFDESTMAYLTQVSVPVLDGDVAIGAITFGLSVDAIEAEAQPQPRADVR